VKQKIHTQRRKQLMRMMGENAVAILPAANLHIRNRDVEYNFRQDSDFLYLSGFNEPEAVIILLPGRKQGQYVLFCRQRDKHKETWNGRRYGTEGAQEHFAADEAWPIDELEERLPAMMGHCEKVYYTMGLRPEFDQVVMKCVNDLRLQSRRGARAPYEFVSLEYLLHDMRLFKSREEISLMRKAAKISVQAHRHVMQVCKPGMNEAELEAEFLYAFKKNGADWAYPSIVGGGENACILHYTENNHVLKEKTLVLIDAGAEYEGYASDITRSFPVDGVFTGAQKEIYELVLQSQEAAIKQIKPGNHWNDPHRAAVRVLTRGMVELGLLRGNVTRLIKETKYMKYYMHRTGHWLGLDVHDVGDYKVDEKWRLLEPGMTLTVEPGLYIAPGSRGAKRWWGIGVRIEDDILVTRDGNDMLTRGLPRTVAEIESLMAS